jgi:cell volume regulation protein A
MTALEIIGFLGILLIIGFIADFLFKKISIPDILILIALGYLIGPVFNIIDPSHVAPGSQIIATLALVVILFHGGLELEFAYVLRSAPRALVLVVLGIAASMAATTTFAYYIMRWDLMNCLLLAAILAGTSPAIVMPLVRRSRAPAQISSLLNLESAFNGALVIVIALIILQIITTGQTGNELELVGRTLAVRISLGIAIGIAAGIVWLALLTVIEGEVYDDILTLAVVLLLYFSVEMLGGSGVMFVLSFGLILGNGVDVARFLHIRRAVEVHRLMMKFHSQMSFLIKTFFFIYLGLMITFDDLNSVILGVILSFVLLVARFIAVLISSAGNRTLFSNKGILTFMLPRGLSAAVVAEVVAVSSLPNASRYPYIIIIVIITTVILTALSIPLFGRKKTAFEDNAKIVAGD